MEPDETLVCVKQVKQEVGDEWDEGVPLPGDIIEGIAEDDNDDSFVRVKAKSELSSHLAKINPQVEFIWLKVRRGNSTLKLKARFVPHKNLFLQTKYSIQAATHPSHIADLDDLTVDHCSELQGTQSSYYRGNFLAWYRITSNIYKSRHSTSMKHHRILELKLPFSLLIFYPNFNFIYFFFVC